MNKIILCEGETDAILLSYYLGKVSGWAFCKKSPVNIAIKADSFQESVNWYEKGEDKLLICAVGGKDNVKAFFNKKVLKPIVNAGSFSRIALVLDRDDKEVGSMESHASAIFRPVISSMINNKWIENTYEDAYGNEQTIEALLVAIPTEHQGALETLMMDSISEDPYDAEIVKRAGAFVKEMRDVASKYIDSNRQELKAHLGVTWAVQYPEKVFKLMNEQIQSVPWEKSAILHKCFEQLENI
ncbi:DUF3226 domain-containing protein [Butyrivibrio sp.]|uniref:DUF3226 domain-containing protein n=1 Tax=Butyrivibrio sp. TaxID=28121 RepID=UPI0025B87FAF|nr:DUF3226 domain-containing protein [Butyrivibrio sp.]MBQ9302866.1 hypothetical protein [Butyrivibrio sp.]